MIGGDNNYRDTKKALFDNLPENSFALVNADDKKRARLNCITHLLSMIPYEYIIPEEIELPELQNISGYVRTPISEQTFIPEIF